MDRRRIAAVLLADMISADNQREGAGLIGAVAAAARVDPLRCWWAVNLDPDALTALDRVRLESAARRMLDEGACMRVSITGAKRVNSALALIGSVVDRPGTRVVVCPGDSTARVVIQQLATDGGPVELDVDVSMIEEFGAC